MRRRFPRDGRRGGSRKQGTRDPRRREQNVTTFEKREKKIWGKKREGGRKSRAVKGKRRPFYIKLHVDPINGWMGFWGPHADSV